MAWDVTYQGGRFAQRGYDMYREVERLTPFDIFISQGGYNPGGVSASAGTHDREAVDVSASLLTPDQRWTVVTHMRRVGWAAWIRTPDQGFPWHVHGVPINGDLSTAARAQVVQYSQHLNGLAGRGPDDGPPGYYDMTWEKYQNSPAYRPPIDTGGTTGQDDMTPEESGKLNDLHNMMNAFKGGPEAPSFANFFRVQAARGVIAEPVARQGGPTGTTSVGAVTAYSDAYQAKLESMLRDISDRLARLEAKS